ncbi:uncharacterized protein JCM10292_005183 [Rhodotorula paludigena]|uniref:uncharacterized protein n=1 Tax=Rhodotorula paludigena TaxID=86838 RepID=UPI00316D49CC
MLRAGASEQLVDVEAVKSALSRVEADEKLAAALREISASEADPEVRTLALDDLEPAESALSSSRHALLSALTDPPPTTALSAIVEIKFGGGGIHAALFVADLLRLYRNLADRHGWTSEVLEALKLEAPGEAYREAMLEVTGERAYEYLRREAGGHRVQRPSATDQTEKMHTSVVSVVVWPLESETTSSKGDDLLSEKDVKVETMRARGAGGQHVNRTESAVRLTHLPTGITVSMQDSRSQHENRNKAMRVLRARLLDQKLQEEQAAWRAVQSMHTRTAYSSDKIRTYNFPQGRVTDHRLEQTYYALGEALDGGEILDVLNYEVEAMERRERIEEFLAGLDKQD